MCSLMCLSVLNHYIPFPPHWPVSFTVESTEIFEMVKKISGGNRPDTDCETIHQSNNKIDESSNKNSHSAGIFVIWGCNYVLYGVVIY